MSLDGYIAGANGEADLIVANPEVASNLARLLNMTLTDHKLYKAAGIVSLQYAIK